MLPQGYSGLAPDLAVTTAREGGLGRAGLEKRHPVLRHRETTIEEESSGRCLGLRSLEPNQRQDASRSAGAVV